MVESLPLMATSAVTETVVDVVEEIVVGVMVDTVRGGKTTAALDTLKTTVEMDEGLRVGEVSLFDRIH